MANEGTATPSVFSAAIVGASGYVGGELLRLLSGHEGFSIGALTAETSAGSNLLDHHPQLASDPQMAGRMLLKTTAEILDQHDVVFLALPHGESPALAAQLSPDTLVVDCSASFRLQNAEDWDQYYGGLYGGSWPYGLPELPDQRVQLKEARRIAVPGCYPTAATLALAPACVAGLGTDDVVVVAASGTSGAGRALKRESLASEVVGSAAVYGAGGVHRHTPEIRQNLQQYTSEKLRVSFTPMIVPMTRGIVATCSLPARPGVTNATLRDVYTAAYENEPFVSLLAEGIWPTTASVYASNSVHVQVALDEQAGRIIAVAAIDNLTKGTAGAAIQSANIALGIAETTGLPKIGVAP